MNYWYTTVMFDTLYSVISYHSKESCVHLSDIFQIFLENQHHCSHHPVHHMTNEVPSLQHQYWENYHIGYVESNVHQLKYKLFDGI